MEIEKIGKVNIQLYVKRKFRKKSCMSVMCLGFAIADDDHIHRFQSKTIPKMLINQYNNNSID